MWWKCYVCFSILSDSLTAARGITAAFYFLSLAWCGRDKSAVEIVFILVGRRRANERRLCCGNKRNWLPDGRAEGWLLSRYKTFLWHETGSGLKYWCSAEMAYDWNVIDAFFRPRKGLIRGRCREVGNSRSVTFVRVRKLRVIAKHSLFVSLFFPLSPATNWPFPATNLPFTPHYSRIRCPSRNGHGPRVRCEGIMLKKSNYRRMKRLWTCSLRNIVRVWMESGCCGFERLPHFANDDCPVVFIHLCVYGWIELIAEWM